MAGYHYHYNFYLQFLVSSGNTQLLSEHCYTSFILVSFFVAVHSYRKKKVQVTKEQQKSDGYNSPMKIPTVERQHKILSKIDSSVLTSK